MQNFHRSGTLNKVKPFLLIVFRSSNTPETRGTALVVYEDIFDAKNACDHLSDFNVCKRYLVVLYYQSTKVRSDVFLLSVHLLSFLQSIITDYYSFLFHSCSQSSQCFNQHWLFRLTETLQFETKAVRNPYSLHCHWLLKNSHLFCRGMGTCGFGKGQAGSATDLAVYVNSWVRTSID